MKIDPYSVNIQSYGFIDPPTGKEMLGIRLDMNYQKAWCIMMNGDTLDNGTLADALINLAETIRKGE